MQINWTGFYMERGFTGRCFRTDFNKDASFLLLNSLTKLVFIENQCCKVFFPNIARITFKEKKPCILLKSC